MWDHREKCQVEAESGRTRRDFDWLVSISQNGNMQESKQDTMAGSWQMPIVLVLHDELYEPSGIVRVSRKSPLSGPEAPLIT